MLNSPVLPQRLPSAISAAKPPPMRRPPPVPSTDRQTLTSHSPHLGDQLCECRTEWWSPIDSSTQIKRTRDRRLPAVHHLPEVLDWSSREPGTLFNSNAPQNTAPKPMSEFVESIVLDTSAREYNTAHGEPQLAVLRRFLDGRVV